MKTSMKTTLAAIILLSVVACKKESIHTNTGLAAADASKSVQALVIGQDYQGGIIIYIDTSGAHGLIAAKTDQSLGATWYNGVYGITGATGKIIGTGPANTRKIVKAQGTTGVYAARVCAQLKVDVYNDWYLPSKNELAEVYKQKAIIGAGNFVYWSSTEVDGNIAWAQNFSTGGRKQSDKSKIYHVRAVRTF
ncbi:DUF1566 domain-containing protein [Panacibacter ginsenosidivorans]|uniref:DUF1566 domain-containing protein n=1 Tax=Panacibacter ginsenosidivorans TaxID=1813871 RepID=A0A5B8VGX1_9BACT|nr:DUF1566 domain-containing protein [Panacibacter ginsenosidivorans]QEC69816.1 DUF1566 domain-containing protein [Panacibacter ginsenosidivorans]